MKAIILGGDGFCGWPTSLHLSARGHDVVIVDNLSRRAIDNELEVTSLTPIRPMGERLRVWKDLTGREIRFLNFDVAEHYHRLLTLFKDEQPDVERAYGDAGVFSHPGTGVRVRGVRAG